MPAVDPRALEQSGACVEIHILSPDGPFNVTSSAIGFRQCKEMTRTRCVGDDTDSQSDPGSSDGCVLNIISILNGRPSVNPKWLEPRVTDFIGLGILKSPSHPVVNLPLSRKWTCQIWRILTFPNKTPQNLITNPIRRCKIVTRF